MSSLEMWSLPPTSALLLLRYHADTDLLFEVFIRDALFLCLFFQIIDAGQPHLLPHCVEPFHHFRLASDAQVLAALQQELLVNKISQGISLCFRRSCLPSDGYRCFNSSRLVALAFSISDRVMIWSSTRAMISSTISSARSATATRTRAETSKASFLAYSKDLLIPEKLLPENLLPENQDCYDYLSADRQRHPLMNAGTAIVAVFLLIEQAAESVFQVRFCWFC